MPGKKDITEYRVDQLEGAVRQISDALSGIHKSLETLTALSVAHQETKEAMGRAFVRIEDLEKKSESTDRDFNKWFNRGVGVAAAVSVLFTVGGGLIGTSVHSMKERVSRIDQMERDIRQLRAVNKVLLRKVAPEMELEAIDAH